MNALIIYSQLADSLGRSFFFLCNLIDLTSNKHMYNKKKMCFYFYTFVYSHFFFTYAFHKNGGIDEFPLPFSAKDTPVKVLPHVQRDIRSAWK